MTASATICFIDDEPKVLAGLRRSFHGRRGNWDMIFTVSCAEVLERFASRPCDVLVSDLSMPEMTGLDLAHAVKRLAPETEVIVLTGNADLQSAIRAINESDVFRFYTKPCPAEELEQGIAAAIASGRARRRDSNDGLADGLAAALMKLPMGVVVTGSDGRVGYMNTRGTEIVSARDGLFVGGDGVLRAQDSDSSDALHARMAAVLEPAGRSGAVAVARPSMLRPLSVLVSRLAPEGDAEVPRVLLFLNDPEAPLDLSPSVISKLFGLTESEARLTKALAEGNRLEEAAALSGITISSARTYLKTIFGKTGTSRQAELVQLVLTSPATLGGLDG